MNVASAVAGWLKGLRLLYDDECEGPTGDSPTGDSPLVTLSHSVTSSRTPSPCEPKVTPNRYLRRRPPTLPTAYVSRCCSAHYLMTAS